MKLRNLFLLGFASAALLAGCKEDEPLVTPAIEVTPKILTFSGDGETKTVSLTANGAWEASVEYDETSGWLSVSPETGDASDNAVEVEITADKNTGDATRTATVTFTNSTAYFTVSVTQTKAEEGGGDTPGTEKEIVDATVAEFLAADPEDESKLYRLTGTVADLGVVSLMSFTLVDGDDEVQVPTLAVSAESQEDAIAEYGIMNGDKVTLVGVRGELGGQPAVTDAYYESHEQGGDVPQEPQEVSIQEFIDAPESDVRLYQLTGTIDKLEDLGTMHSFMLADEGNVSVQVWGLDESAEKDSDAFDWIDLEQGDKVTLVGKRGSFDGTPQVHDAYYVSHEIGLRYYDMPDVIGLEPGRAVRTEGQVLGIGSDCFVFGYTSDAVVINDPDALAGLEFGDRLTVEGTTASLYGLTSLEDVTVVSNSPDQIYTLAAEDLESKFGEIKGGNVRYVKYTGTVTASGSDYTISVSGSTGHLVSAPASVDLASLAGKEAALEAFYIGEDGNDFYLMPVKAQATSAEVFFYLDEDVMNNGLVIPAGQSSVTFTVYASPEVSYSISVTAGGEFWEDSYTVTPSTGGKGTAEYTIVSGSGINTDSRPHTADVRIVVNNEYKDQLDPCLYDVTLTHMNGTEEGGDGEDGSFVKMTGALADYSGTYLIVFEEASVAFDGSANSAKLRNGPTVSVSIASDAIAATDDLKASAVELVKEGDIYYLKTASGYYLYNPTASDMIMGTEKLPTNKTIYQQKIEYTDGHHKISTVAKGNVLMYYNNAVKFYGSSKYSSADYQKPVLYKLQ